MRMSAADPRAVPGWARAAADGFDPWPDSSVHVEWGPEGAALAAGRGDVVVVVDVFSLSTAMSIAVARELTCLVYSGAEIEEMGGPGQASVLLGARSLRRERRAEPGRLTLSPESLTTAEPGQRVVFTSPDGAAVVRAAAKAPAVLVAGPRNATACCGLVAEYMGSTLAGRVTLVACGERWSSAAPGTLGRRAAVEDWAGAGSICSRLAEFGYSLSAEARLAARLWESGSVLEDLADCLSARELRSRGFTADVELALQVDVDVKVPARMPGEQTRRVFVGQGVPTG
jgi:2-phosphosulfolactate phosphatase